jgi:hypothetical protein
VGVWLCSLSVLGGCLDDAPTFAPRGQILPFINAGQIEPPMGAVYQGPIPFPINVPFRSEDVNIDLEARLYQDLVPSATQGVPALEVSIAAGIYEDTSRSVSLDWGMDLEGCHSLTLILTYFDNYDASGLPIDDTRAARVTWWLDVADVNDDVTVASCPGVAQRQP